MTYKPTIIDKQANLINKKFKEDQELAANASDSKTLGKLNDAILALEKAPASLDLRGNKKMSGMLHNAIMKQMSMMPRRTVDHSFLSDYETLKQEQERKEAQTKLSGQEDQEKTETKPTS